MHFLLHTGQCLGGLAPLEERRLARGISVSGYVHLGRTGTLWRQILKADSVPSSTDVRRSSTNAAVVLLPYLFTRTSMLPMPTSSSISHSIVSTVRGAVRAAAEVSRWQCRTRVRVRRTAGRFCTISRAEPFASRAADACTIARETSWAPGVSSSLAPLLTALILRDHSH